MSEIKIRCVDEPIARLQNELQHKSNNFNQIGLIDENIISYSDIVYQYSLNSINVINELCMLYKTLLEHNNRYYILLCGDTPIKNPIFDELMTVMSLYKTNIITLLDIVIKFETEDWIINNKHEPRIFKMIMNKNIYLQNFQISLLQTNLKYIIALLNKTNEFVNDIINENY